MVNLCQDMDKRFDTVISRINNFMHWSFSTTLIVSGLGHEILAIIHL